MHILPRLLAAFLLCAAAPALAGGDYNYGSKSGLSRGTTNSVVRAIQRGIKDCTRLDTVYRYDCYRQSYGKAAATISGNPAYAEAEAALRRVESTLANVVARNKDAAASPKRQRGKTYTPIQPAAAPKAKAQFRSALAEAETVLLRASASPGDDFAQIAAAVRSNTELLKAWLRALRLA